MADLLYHDNQRQLSLQASDTATPEMASFLERTVWGTRGVLYTKQNLASALMHLPSPTYFSLRENHRLTALGICLKKTIRVGSRTFAAIYPAALAVDPARRGQGYGRLMVERVRPYLLEELGPSGLLYGFVETGNTRSLGLFSRISRQLGIFHTQIFCRFLPKDDSRVGPAREPEQEDLLAGLYHLYADHALLDFAHSFRLDQYFVLRDRGEVVAGVQAEVWQWSIKRLPGPQGFILVRVLPRLPFLRRWFNAEQLRFLKLGNLYVRVGREAELFTLVEALLARHRVHFAMAYLDRRSPVYQLLAATGRFGFLNNNLELKAHVLADFVGLMDEEIASFCHRPLVISPLDAL